MKKILILNLILFLFLSPTPSQASTNKSVSFQAEVWADNWFSLYVNGKKVGEDSVPITTERSFNSEKIKFTATYPFTVGVVAKDFTENASGLEYIGKSNQQIGDGGFILQIREVVSGRIVSYTGSDWKVLTINKAPLNPECVTSSNPLVDCKHSNISIPSNWASSSFKASNWKSATTFTKEEVGVKGGFFDFNWDPNANLVWSSDLKLDNTILLRTLVKIPGQSMMSKNLTTKNFNLSSPDFIDNGKLPRDFTCDGQGISPSLNWENVPTGAKSLIIIMDSIAGPPRPGEIDSGNHFYLTLYNIPISTNSLKAGETKPGTLGQNFLGRNIGYTPPCSQGPGDKLYSIYIYALDSTLTIAPSEATEKNLLAAMSGKIISKSKISAYYSRV